MNGPISKAVSSALARVFSRRSAILKIVEEKALGTRLTVSGHRNESSIRAYSKTDQTTKRRMSETLTAAGANNSAPNDDSAWLESLSAENINLSPLLTLSQEEHVMRDLRFQTTHSQVSKNFAFYNCNVFFS